MLFFKRKQKVDELLPPPPPDMDLELQQEIQQKPKFFDETLEPERIHEFPEETEFSDLIEDLEGKKPARVSIKRDKTIGKMEPAKKDKVQSKEIVQLKKKVEKIGLKRHGKNIMPKKTASAKIKKGIPDYGINLKDEHEFAEDADTQEDNVGNPETFEEFNFGELSKGLKKGFEKPKEILEAEEEIKGAIDKIKNRETPSFFKNLFSGKAKQEQKIVKEKILPKPINVGNVYFIQNKINEARQMLMSLDLEGAKISYIEIMKRYNNLSSEDKAKVYQEIKELYFERKNAEELKV